MYLGESRRLPRFAGALVGAGIAVAVVVLALPSGGHGGVLPASVDVTVRSDGALAAQPAAPSVVLHSASLRPGTPAAEASFDLVNEAGQPLTAALRAIPSSTELDSLARVQLVADGRTFGDMTIGELRRGTPISLVIASGERRHVRLAIEIPASVETGYEGRHVDLQLVPAVAGEGR